MQQCFEVAGTGLYLPHRRLTAEDVDRRAQRPEGWTRRHVGVLTRHECAAPETLATMATHAVVQAMRNASADWSQIDLIIDASTCRHQPIPCNACCLQQAFGARAAGIPCLDVQSTCLGFVVAMNVANGLLAAGGVRHVLIVTSEAPLLGVNWAEPQSACLMGDGAAAAILRRREPTSDYHFRHQTFAQELEACEVRGGGHRLPPWECVPDSDGEYRFHMDGRRLFRAARRYLPTMVDSLLKEVRVDRSELQVVPHQAAPRAMALVRQLLGFQVERFQDHVAEMGNLIAASIPAVLHRCVEGGIIRRGEHVLLLGTSAGYSQAGLAFRY